MDSNFSDAGLRQVLYVEDHPVNVLLMRALFERRPHLRLTVATTGREALSLAASLQPSLLLLDLRLPDCHGTELLGALQARFGWEHVPAIAVTAEADFMADGTAFDEVWHKPMDLAMVLRGLDHWVGPGPGAAPDDAVLKQPAHAPARLQRGQVDFGTTAGIARRAAI